MKYSEKERAALNAKGKARKVKYIGKKDTLAFDKNAVYEVMAIEKGWYRIKTELGEDYLFPPNIFEIID